MTVMIWKCNASRRAAPRPPETERACARDRGLRDGAVEQDRAEEEAERLNRVEARELRQIERLWLEAEEHGRDPCGGAPRNRSHPHEERGDERRSGEHGGNARDGETLAEDPEERGDEICEDAGAGIRLAAGGELERAPREQRMRGHHVIELVHVGRVVQPYQSGGERDGEDGGGRGDRASAQRGGTAGSRGELMGLIYCPKRRRPRGKPRAFRRTASNSC